jgi:2-polyprenyl-3-methyl-5-hydroxy-6-metoxy-1,4-benzoquinol methylase
MTKRIAANERRTSISKTEVFASSRLALQASQTHQIDMHVLSPILNKLLSARRSKRIKIIDVGSGYGYLAHQRFGANDQLDVIGIDINPKFVRFANEHFGSNHMRFVTADIEEFAPSQPVHLIIMMQVLQHLREPEATVQRYWRFLVKGGYIVARNSDDQLNITYPDSQNLRYLINETNRIPGSPDRNFGRRLFSMFRPLIPAPNSLSIHLLPQMVTGGTKNERAGFFDEMHGFRALYAERAAERTPSFAAKKRSERFKKISIRERRRFKTDKELFAAEVQIFASARR